ncbi:class I SAM-dependent methyltransferase [Metabacillus fastidiosus]|uniref:class I SAM-dependent methyltransferase n=1 Tax=Metabacillus fastidiosus TaxID=1458 RepID=UPI003D2B0439
MENNKVSLTALVSCFARGYHTVHNAKPIFNDYFANQLLKEEEKKMIASNWSNAALFFDQDKGEAFNDDEKLNWVMNTQCVPQLVSRSRYAEDHLLSAIERGVKQYVILGAGFDTFALRQEDLPEDFVIYEVDHPDTQKFKIQRMKEMHIEKPDNLRFVPADFMKESLQVKLKEQGFDEQKLSFFSLLGVSMYLSKADFLKILSFISNIAPAGSSFVFDYLDELAFHPLLAAKKLTQMRQITAKTGEPMITGFDPLYLDIEVQHQQMLLYENLSPENIEDRYFNGQEDELHAFDHFHFAHLVVNK